MVESYQIIAPSDEIKMRELAVVEMRVARRRVVIAC